MHVFGLWEDAGVPEGSGSTILPIANWATATLEIKKTQE